jgi:excisionase family DNA binding protein
MPRPKKIPISGPPLRVGEAARLGGCCERTIRRLIRDGYIPILKFGRAIRIPRAAYLRWLDEGHLVTGGK